MQWFEDEHSLQVAVHFRSQLDLARFVLDLARYSDTLNHHADMEIKGYSLHLSLTTHDEGNKVSEKDRALQHFIRTHLEGYEGLR